MIIKELVERLKHIPQDSKVKVASDEEWNTLYKSVEIEIDPDDHSIVFYGLSGSEE
jgi:hypothetical protein